MLQRRAKLRLRYERSRDVDAEKRLLAPSPFDVLRTITTGLRSETPEEPMTVCLVGIIAFDHVDLFEDLPANAEDPTRLSRISSSGSPNPRSSPSRGSPRG